MHTPPFIIPTAELHEFSQLPERVRADVHAALCALAAIETTPGANLSEKAFAVARSHDFARGFSFSTLLRMWYRYRAHGWRALVDRRRGPARKGAVE
jgi:hypothetical protein